MTREMNHARAIAALLLCFATCIGIAAKEKKVKLSKNIVYQGEVVGKFPHGEGTLMVYSQLDKKASVLSIKGTFENNSVSNATVEVNGGTTFTANDVKYSVSTTSSEESINIQMDRFSLTTASGITSEHDENNGITIKYYNNKNTLKAWRLSETTTDDNVNGVLPSNFMPCNHVLNNIQATTDDIAKQRCILSFETEKTYSDDALEVKPSILKEVEMKSGVVITSILEEDEISSGSVITFYNGYHYSYPNGSSITMNMDKEVAKYKMVLEGGIIEQTDDGFITINYDNGDKFVADNKDGIKLQQSFIGLCRSISDITLLNGSLQHLNTIRDIYKDGSIVRTQCPLKDGGYLIKRNGMIDEIVFNYGRFKPTTADGLIEKKEYSPENTAKDYILNNGVLTDTYGNQTIYENGEFELKTISNLRMYAKNHGYKIEETPTHSVVGIRQLEAKDNHLVFYCDDEAPQIDNQKFYINVAFNLSLSYPKSLISKEDNLLHVESCTVPNSLPSINLDPSNYNVAWIYEPIDLNYGRNYGDTKGIYVYDKRTGQIVCDISKTLQQGNNKAFKKVIVTKPEKQTTPAQEKQKYAPKKKYHPEGRLEQCHSCFGKGYWTNWRDPNDTKPCPMCYGRGYRVEHYW